VSRADGEDGRLFTQAAEAIEAEEQLRPLVALPVHRELVVRQDLERLQQANPLGVVPFSRVRQLAELDISRHEAAALLRSDRTVPRFEFIRGDEHAQNLTARLAGVERLHVMAAAGVIGIAPEQHGVRAAHEVIVGAERFQPGLVHRRILADADVVAPARENQVELRRREQPLQDVRLTALPVMLTERVALDVIRLAAEHDPERFADERVGRHR
jgi:hypothetical protein